jgi:CRP-like cAMP-binding protein
LSGLVGLKKDQVLFREGDLSDAMYVIKSGRIAITKSKGESEVVLAELIPGDMLGEMAFFDNRPRSAGAKAMVDSVVIVLPFKALNAQFKTFPEWLKAIVRTVNNHLRSANQKIRNLEKTSDEDIEYLSPHLVTQLMAVLGLVGSHYGAKDQNGIDIPSGLLRRFTIQVFQLPTAKMQRVMEILQSFDYMRIEDLGEGRTRLTIKNLPFILQFVEFYNDWIFKSEDKRITITEKEIAPLKALLHYGAKEPLNANGAVKVNLTQIQQDCLKDLNFPFNVAEMDSLIEKKLASEKMSTDTGLALSFQLNELTKLLPIWELIHTFQKAQRLG